MRFNFITIFPNLVEPYFKDSILGRAVNNSIVKLKFINPRDFSNDKHLKVDDYMIGGGAGLLMKPEPLFEAINSLKDTHIIYLTPSGKKFTQN
ncbi:MAG: tRNA (guanosine(37)-N1)-methyltransferase TrmD, partial [Campylobacter hyointestinalis]